MNFDNMWSIMHGHSDIVSVLSITIAYFFIQFGLRHRFWIIALPLMAIVIPVFLWSDLERMTHYIQKKTIAHRIMEVSLRSLTYTVMLTACWSFHRRLSRKTSNFLHNLGLLSMSPDSVSCSFAIGLLG